MNLEGVLYLVLLYFAGFLFRFTWVPSGTQTVVGQSSVITSHLQMKLDITRVAMIVLAFWISKRFTKSRWGSVYLILFPFRMGF